MKMLIFTTMTECIMVRNSIINPLNCIQTIFTFKTISRAIYEPLVDHMFDTPGLKKKTKTNDTLKLPLLIFFFFFCPHHFQ